MVENDKKRSNDPAYRAFVEWVTASAKGVMIEIKDWRLFRLWFVSRTFEKMWTHPKRSSASQMIQKMLVLDFSKQEIECVLLAWMYFHGRTPSSKEIQQEVTNEIERVAKDNTTKAAIEALTRRRREQRRKASPKKGGRPVKKDGVQSRISEALQNGPLTPAQLRDLLDVSHSSVRSTLHRMVAAGSVKNDGGIYSVGLAPEIAQAPLTEPLPSPERPMLAQPSSRVVDPIDTFILGLVSDLQQFRFQEPVTFEDLKLTYEDFGMEGLHKYRVHIERAKAMQADWCGYYDGNDN